MTSPSPNPSQSYSSMDRGDVDLIGAHCQYQYCNQLDFLPFRCESCKATYCLDHRTETAHQCPHPGAWASARRKASLSNTTSNSTTSNSSTSPSSTRPLKPCAHPPCNTPLNTPRSPAIHCPTCNRSYCLKHRLLEDHACSTLTPIGARPASSKLPTAALQTDKARQALSRLRAWGKEKQTSILAARPAPKPSSGAARIVALNQLKRTAKGDEKIPPAQRLYLHIEAEAPSMSANPTTTTPKPSTAPANPKGTFFYSSSYSIGRILDAAAKSLQVPNVNNRGGGEEQKIRVFHVEGGRLLDFGEKVGDAVGNGDTLVLLRGVGEGIPDLIEV
ncbi:MAG: hypothetical protein M1817_006177 [Caeruleum heppii]|nr:MAG: hypothetical protein M1817_006177 [Caeruleum heppii]